MRFILKDGGIHIVENYGFANNKIEGTVEVPGIVPDRIEVSVNDLGFQELQGNTLTVDKKKLKGLYLTLVFKVTVDDKTHLFKADKLPLTHMILLGQPFEVVYPEKITQLERRMDALTTLIEEKTGWTVDTMKELVETFEDITRKGSLF